MTLDEPPEPTPPARTLGYVWVAVGALALIGSIVATVAMVAAFGAAAIVIGLALIAVANLRDKSRARASRTLSGDPPPPASAPFRPMPEPPPVPEPEDGGDEAQDEDTEHEDAEDEDAEPGSGAAESGRASDEETVPEARISASDVEDGEGNLVSDEDRSGRPRRSDDDREGT